MGSKTVQVFLAFINKTHLCQHTSMNETIIYLRNKQLWSKWSYFYISLTDRTKEINTTFFYRDKHLKLQFYLPLKDCSVFLVSQNRRKQVKRWWRQLPRNIEKPEGVSLSLKLWILRVSDKSPNDVVPPSLQLFVLQLRIYRRQKAGTLFVLLPVH